MSRFGVFGVELTIQANFGVAYTGLTGTVGYKLRNGDGTQYQARTPAGISEVAAGIYEVKLAANIFSAFFNGSALWDTGGASPVYATEDILLLAPPGSSADLALVKAKTDLLGAGTVEVVSPVAESLVVTLVAGDDYYAADGRALTFSSSSWPDLTGATAAFMAYVQSGGAALTTAGTIPAFGGSPQTVQVELSAMQTNNLAHASVVGYAVVATLADGHEVTLAKDQLVVVAR